MLYIHIQYVYICVCIYTGKCDLPVLHLHLWSLHCDSARLQHLARHLVEFLSC